MADLTLNLDIDASENDKAVRLRKTIEDGFIRSLLAACEEELTRRLGSPAPLVFIRYVQVDWDFSAEMLSEISFAKSLGCELAAGLFGQIHASQAQPSLTWPKEENNSVVFMDQAHYEAGYIAHLANESAGTLPWYFARIAKQVIDPWSLIVRSSPSHHRILVQYLRQYQALTSVLRCCPDNLKSSLVRIAGSLSDDEFAAVAESHHDQSVVEEKQVIMDSPAAEEFQRRERSEVTGSVPEVPEAPANSPSIPPEQPIQSTASSDLIRPPAIDVGTSLAEASPSWTASKDPNTDTENTRHPPKLKNNPIVSLGSTASKSSPDAPHRVARDSMSGTVLHTEYGGLVYLLARALELDLGEHLWCAGVVEAQLFHRIPQAILGASLAADDSSQGMLSGLWGHVRPLSIEPWAEEEIRNKLQRSWQRATQKQSERPVPSWLVPTQLVSYLHSVDSDTHTDDCIRYCAATLLSLFLRCRGDEFLPDIIDCFRSSARIELSSERMHVRLGMNSVDMRQRRAGLDFDPGWIPWMKRKVILQFGDGEEDID